MKNLTRLASWSLNTARELPSTWPALAPVLDAVQEDTRDGWRWRIRTADVLAIGRSLERTESSR